MSHNLSDPLRSLPAPACDTGLGWLLQAVLPGSSGGNDRANSPEACFPAQQRRSGREAMIAAAIFSVWSFLAVGALLIANAGAAFGLPLWLPVWLIYVHTLTLLPAMFFMPLSQPGDAQTARVARGQSLAAHAMLLLTAWLLLASPCAPCRWLGVFWVALILLDGGLRLLRAGLRLATRAD